MSQTFRDDADRYHEFGCHIQKRLITLFGEVHEGDEEFGTQRTAQRFITAMNLLDEGPGGKKGEDIVVDICTPGGSVIDMWAIYDRICQSKCSVTGRVWGEASSAGSVILQACDKRLMSQHAYLMLHEGSWSIDTYHNRNAEAAADQIKRERKMMVDVFARAMCRDAKYVEDLLIIDKYFYANEVVKLGLADKVLENSSPEWHTGEHAKRLSSKPVSKSMLAKPRR